MKVTEKENLDAHLKCGETAKHGFPIGKKPYGKPVICGCGGSNWVILKPALFASDERQIGCLNCGDYYYIKYGVL